MGPRQVHGVGAGPLTNNISNLLAFCGLVDLLVEHVNGPSSVNCSLSFLPKPPISWTWTLEWLYELSRRPSTRDHSYKSDK